MQVEDYCEQGQAEKYEVLLFDHQNILLERKQNISKYHTPDSSFVTLETQQVQSAHLLHGANVKIVLINTAGVTHSHLIETSK